MYRYVIKPICDLVIALSASIILFPVLILIGCIIKAETKGPALFKQPRLGKNGKVFFIYKFRSMVTDQSNFKKTQELFETDPRITGVGRFIRKTSLDELPQLLNVLRGEMSFIGPRPPLPHFPKKYCEYNDFERQRFLVKPGISGLAQIRCREVHDWDINIPIDVEYVKNYSFVYDAKLFLNSLFSFFQTKNIYRKKEA